MAGVDGAAEAATECVYGSLDRRWSQLRRAQEAARLLREGGDTAAQLSARQMEQYAATYSRATARQLYIHRKDGGFGFTLRHFIVYPPEEGETEGPLISDPMDTIFVKSVKDGGPAVAAGLNIGDRIVSVNGESVAGRSYAQVVQMIQKSRDLLRLEVVPKQDDILQVYFSEIAQNPETNKRAESGPPAGKPPWPASVCSSSSRESSPLSSKTSDSARDSVYGHCRDGRQMDIRTLYPTTRMPSAHLPPSSSRHTVAPTAVTSAAGNNDWENLYETIGNDRLKVPSATQSSGSGSTEHVYAVPAMATSSVSSSTLGSGPASPPNNNNSRDSLDSDSSLMAGFTSPQEDPLISRIKKDCERKEEFLKNQTYPAYLSSPPKDIDSGPYGIASLANTMPPPRSEPPPSKQEMPDKSSGGGGTATKNFFMDIYAKELSKMQSVSKSSATTKKRNFDATQFNTYGLPLGYRRGGNYYDIDNFSRNNFVIVGSRTLHCEPPQVYQPTPEPPIPACAYCYGPVFPYAYPAYAAAPLCTTCGPPPPPPAPCPDCAIMTMTAPYQPRPPRPNTLPGIQSLRSCRDRHERPAMLLPALPPAVKTPVHMHPDPQTPSYQTAVEPVMTYPVTTPPDGDPRPKLHHRPIKYTADEEEDRNLRRVSYLEATKEERRDTEENLANETGIAPTHSIKKLKSIFAEKAGESLPPPIPLPPSPKSRDPPKMPSCDQSSTITLSEGIKEGYLTCKVAIVDGRKATDRSWKTVYVVLKSKALYMYKDKKMAQENMEYEEKPVKLAESEVEVASDYTKRKNVFRVKTEQGSEYLFQAENELIMKEWVRTIDETAMAIIVDERKDVNKLKKLTSFRNRSPTGQSPSSKTRKSSADQVPTYKEPNKDKKNWKGKVVKQLKKMGGGSGHGPPYPEGGSIGVPLDECPFCPGANEQEFVPYLVKVCCDIVNERGLDIVGIYRVPGNNAAVTYLTEQINKGVDHFALEDHRWQDVNVVSSLLKSFFRKLPDPLFTMDMYSLFIEGSKIEQPAKRLDCLRKLIRDLPEVHYETLRFLTQHLCNVAYHSALNKMEIRNLAIVFGPTLVRTTDDNMVSMVTDMSQQCRIIESLLSNWEYFFTDTEDVEVKEEACDENIVTGAGNQSIMLANLHKLEDAGKLSSPKGDVSAKDIVSSIISAANRKMLRAAVGTKNKKESLSESDDRSLSRQDDGHLDSRRESESVIHGALQIATAVPGLMTSIAGTGSSLSGSREESGRDTPSEELTGRPSYSRQGSRGSISGDIFKRRGSLPVCQSKRGSICAYSGGAMCESTPVGEICEARIAMMKAETVTNGVGDSQEVVTGKLSLVNVTSEHDIEPTAHHQYKFPIETYTGLDAATAERIKKFEAETKAMLTRSPADHLISLGRSSQEMSLSETLSDGSGRYSLPGTASLLAGRARPLTSLTTPLPDSDPLEGGILMEDSYPTDAYDPYPGDDALVTLNYGASLPSLLEPNLHNIPEEILAAFDTQKVALKGTLLRLKPRPRVDELHPDGSDSGEETADAETILGNLSANFDQKMRLLLDPSYQTPASPDISPQLTRRADSSVNHSSPSILDGHQEFPVALSASPSTPDISGARKDVDDVRNELLRARVAARKVELRRSGRVETKRAAETEAPATRRSVGRQEPVLRQVNNRQQLKRSDSLTKREKTELNQRTKQLEKENKVLRLKAQFEQGATGNGRAASSRASAAVHSANSGCVSSNNFDINKVRKKLSDNRNRRIKRRHTVGGTKDFAETILSKLNSEERDSKSSWERLCSPLTSGQDLMVVEERRLSLPDCGGSLPGTVVESHV